MIKNSIRYSQSILTVNPFKGHAGLIVRTMLKEPAKEWSGAELASELRLSKAWVNRVLGTLESQRFIQRSKKGPESYSEIIDQKELIKKWLNSYQFMTNTFHFYLHTDGAPLERLVQIARREKWNIAVTGYAAANLIKESINNVPPMVYLWPNSKEPQLFRQALEKLENVEDFIPVQKNANLIIVEPYLKDSVLYDTQTMSGIPVVSPVQLFLDLHGLDQGPSIIRQLAEYWEKHGLPYEI